MGVTAGHSRSVSQTDPRWHLVTAAAPTSGGGDITKKAQGGGGECQPFGPQRNAGGEPSCLKPPRRPHTWCFLTAPAQVHVRMRSPSALVDLLPRVSRSLRCAGGGPLCSFGPLVVVVQLLGALCSGETGGETPLGAVGRPTGATLPRVCFSAPAITLQDPL